MKSDKTDHRSKYSQMVMREGLIKLLSGKPLSKVSVAEVCAAAGVNRSTFYHHFYDVFDVYESIETGFYEDLRAKLENKKVYELDRQFFKEIMLLIYKNADLVGIILKNLGSSDFLKRLTVFLKDKFVKEWSENHKNVPVGQLEQIFTYSMNGSIALVAEWISGGMPQPLDEISELIGKLNNLIMRGSI